MKLTLDVIWVRKDQKGQLMLIKQEMYHGHEANPPKFWKEQEHAGSRTDGKNTRMGVSAQRYNYPGRRLKRSSLSHENGDKITPKPLDVGYLWRCGLSLH